MRITSGHPANFSLLHNRSKGVHTAYVAFDLLCHDGRDVRATPIEERQAMLEKMVGRDSAATVFASTVAEGDRTRS